jgi:nucleoside-diphosphate-sugar epimerase
MENKKVLVTGATGYVAGWIIKELLTQGHTVNGTVRDLKNKEKYQHLLDIEAQTNGKLVLYQANLLNSGSFEEAISGCEVVFHTASPFSLNVKDPQKELVDPALEGTRNILEQVNKTASVKKVVLTSSCAAMYTDCSDVQNLPNKKLTEDIWNTTASLDYQPYSYSKTVAEKEAWKINENKDWKLVVINPSLVFGPALNGASNTSESYTIFKQLMDGTQKMGVANIGFGVVDVRDVAIAHVRAGMSDNANGRYITSAFNSSMLEVSKILHDKYAKQYKIGSKPLPKWLLSIVGPMINKTLTRKSIKNNINVEFNADNSKIKNDLKIEFRDLKTTVIDTAEDFIKNGLI